MAAGSIVIDLLMRTGSFETDTKRAERAMLNLRKQVDASVSAIGTGVAVAATAAAAGMMAMATNAIEAMAALDDVAETTGATVEGLSRMVNVARITGADVGIVETAIVRLNKALSGADDESKGAGKALDALGLSFAELRALSPDQQLELVAKRLNEFEDGAGKTSIAVALLGKSGASYLPLLKDIANMTEVTSTVTAKQAGEAEALANQWRGLKVQAEDLSQSIASSVIPALSRMIGEFTEGIKVAGGLGSAIRLFGLGLDVGDPGKQIKPLREELERLQKIPKGSDYDYQLTARAIDDTQKKLQFLKYQQAQAALSGVENNYGNESRGTKLEGKKPAPYIQPAKTGGGGSAGRGGGGGVSDLQRMTKAFADQAGTLGMSADAVELYRYKLAGATPAQLEFAQAVNDAKGAFEEQKKALQEGASVTEKMRTPAEALGAELGKLDDLLSRNAIEWDTYAKAVESAQKSYTDTIAAAQEAEVQQEAARLAARDSLYSGLQTEEEELLASYERRKQAILSATEITEIERQDLLKRLNDKFAADQQASLDSTLSAQYQAFASLFGGLADLAKNYSGEQSSAYRALFAVSKAFAIADAMIKVQQAIAAAAASGPFPWNLGAMASVAAAVGGVVGAISSVSFGGARAAGGAVSENRRYLVGERGPEMFVPNIAGTIVPNDVVSGGRDKAPVINIRNVNAFDSSVLGDYIGSDAGERVIMNVVRRNETTIRQMAGVNGR